MLLITACKTNDKHVNLINTKAVKVNESGVVVESGNIVRSNENTSDSVVAANNKNRSSINDTNNNQSNNIKSNDSNKVSKPDEQMINVSITIDCKTILDNMDDLKAGYLDFIPKDGIVLESVVIRVKKDSTVLNVLEAVNEKYNLNLKTHIL